MNEKPAYVYVLHLETPLAHAQHYIGCTCDPRARFITHAQGRGARIIEAALLQGIRFKVGAIGVTHRRGLRRIERQVKDWHGAAQFCECCTSDPRAMPGTRPYPLSAVTFPLWSDELARLQPKIQQEEVRFARPDDPMSLTGELTALMKAEKDALGFIPSGGLGGLSLSVAAGRLIICRVDGRLAGYVAFTENDDDVKVHQCVTEDVFRGCGYGRRMVELLAESRPGKTLKCRVRDDLPANEFWTAIGFQWYGNDTHETSGQRIRKYRRNPVRPLAQEQELDISAA